MPNQQLIEYIKQARATIAVIVIAAILFIGGGWFVYRYFIYKIPVQSGIVADQSLISEEWKTYRSKDGFSINYPSKWSFGENKNGGACMGSDQKYVDFYCYGETSIELPKIGFKAKLIIDRHIVPSGMPQREALRQEPGRELLPLINEKYPVINGVTAYRALRQIKKGEHGLLDSSYVIDITRTDVEYSFLKDNDLYRVWFELDDDKPDEYIYLFDKVAQTFRLIEK